MIFGLFPDAMITLGQPFSIAFWHLALWESYLHKYHHVQYIDEYRLMAIEV